MADFTIKRTLISHEVHNAIITLICQVPGSSQPHEVKVYVSDILMIERRIKGNDSAIVQAARSWAEPKLREASSITDISELKMHTENSNT
ncbi:MAG: hypothetical protein HYV35_01880 [Lentisphaerae bacterium]|nr:hypothetical protein [Lentisphaerota bacterium]